MTESPNEITIDGALYVRKDSLPKPTDISSPHLKLFSRELISDECNVMCLGSLELKGTWISSRLTFAYLEKAVKILKELKPESVDIIFGNDYPVILGKLDKKECKASGIVIAPRVLEGETGGVL